MYKLKQSPSRAIIKINEATPSQRRNNRFSVLSGRQTGILQSQTRESQAPVCDSLSGRIKPWTGAEPAQAMLIHIYTEHIKK